MQSSNDVTIRGEDFAKAVRSIMPHQRKGHFGDVAIGPASEPGRLRLEGFYATSEVAAEGEWIDTIRVNARLLRVFATGRPPSVFRLVYFEGRLLVNESTILVGIGAEDGEAKPPSNMPTRLPGQRKWRG